MKIRLAILALAAMPAFSQQILGSTPNMRIPHHRVKPMLSSSTAFGDVVLAQVADGSGWQTLITIVNLRSTPNTFTIDCYGDDGNPKVYSWAGIGAHTSLTGTLQGNGSIEVSTTGTAAATNQGWCYLDTNPSSSGDIAGFAIFKYGPTGQEVSVPTGSELSRSLILAFDNTAGYSYGVALVNADANLCGSLSDNGTVSIKDANGVEFSTGTFSLAGCGHTSFILADRFPATRNRVGTVTFALTDGLTLTGLGLRASPAGALTSVDMLEPMTY
jgi:hypothetical protein